MEGIKGINEKYRGWGVLPCPHHINGRDSMKTVEEPRPVRCAECEGAGTFERVVGEDRSGMGGVSPITAEAGCEDCNGEGLKGCAWCGETPAFQYDPTGDVECPSCHKELLEE